MSLVISSLSNVSYILQAIAAIYFYLKFKVILRTILFHCSFYGILNLTDII